MNGGQRKGGVIPRLLKFDTLQFNSTLFLI